MRVNQSSKRNGRREINERGDTRQIIAGDSQRSVADRDLEGTVERSGAARIGSQANGRYVMNEHWREILNPHDPYGVE